MRRRCRRPGPTKGTTSLLSQRGAGSAGVAGDRREAAIVGAPRACWAELWVCPAAVEKEEPPTFSLLEACTPVTAGTGPEGHGCGQPARAAGREGSGWRDAALGPRASSQPAARPASSRLVLVHRHVCVHHAGTLSIHTDPHTHTHGRAHTSQPHVHTHGHTHTQTHSRRPSRTCTRRVPHSHVNTPVTCTCVLRTEHTCAHSDMHTRCSHGRTCTLTHTAVQTGTP